MGYARKMPENMEGLQIVGKKFYKADEGAALYSMGIHTFERIAVEAKAKLKIGKSVLYNVEKDCRNKRNVCNQCEGLQEYTFGDDIHAPRDYIRLTAITYQSFGLDKKINLQKRVYFLAVTNNLDVSNILQF